MKFSERKGLTPVRKEIQTDSMSDELRSSLWNLLDMYIWQQERFLFADYGTAGIDPFSHALWFAYFRKPVDQRPDRGHAILKVIRQYFFGAEWYEVYNFMEWVLNYEKKKPNLTAAVNVILERELAGFRFVGNVFTDVTDEQEVAALEEALADHEFPGVRAHLGAALRLMSNREAPDYRNSIKESISAVEAMAQHVSGRRKATLGDALAVIERNGKIHGALKEGFSKLYGYTSDEGGIRHAMLEEPDLGPADAKFFLLSCTSFIGYLKSKM